jgi:hypothetical protein
MTRKTLMTWMILEEKTRTNKKKTRRRMTGEENSKA